LAPPKAASSVTRGRGAGAPVPVKTVPQPPKARPPRQQYVYPQPLPLARSRGPEEVYTPPSPDEEGARLRFGTPGIEISLPQARQVISLARQRRKWPSERQFSRLSTKSAKVEQQRVPSLPQRLEKLPPLQRAVVWAEILGPPGGQHRDFFP
jgi:hypothetical protein